MPERERERGGADIFLPMFGAAACLRSRQLEASGMTLLTKNVTPGCYRGRVNDKREIGSVSGILRCESSANRSIPIEADRGDADRAFGGPLKTIIEQKKPKRSRIDSNLITFLVSLVFIHM